MFSPKAVMLCLQIWALWFWLSLQIWNFENIFHSLTSNNWIKYSELCLPCYLMIFNRFFDPIIGWLIHNSINLVMFPFYNWHLSSSQSLKLIEDLFCDTLLPNIGSFDSKIELVDDYFLQCPVDLYLIFAIFKFEISSLMNWIYFPSLIWIFLPAAAWETQVQTRKKNQFIELEISNMRMSKIKCR